jgi:FkbM family methyltransferase
MRKQIYPTRTILAVGALSLLVCAMHVNLCWVSSVSRGCTTGHVMMNESSGVLMMPMTSFMHRQLVAQTTRRIVADIPMISPMPITSRQRADVNLCQEMLLTNMPINAKGQTTVHHYVAGTGKWNEHQRWDTIKLTTPCTIWYVGGNKDGADGVRLQNEYPCDIHVFEPVPSFVRELKKNWKDVPRSTVHAYGLGAYSRTVEHVQTGEGQGTFTMSTAARTDGETITIKELGEVWANLNVSVLDLLHVNCEG